MHITDLIYLEKNQKKNRTHQTRCLWAKGTFFVLDAEVDIIFLLRLLSLVKSKWRMNSDLSERNKEAISSFSVSQDRLSLFLFLSPCLHSLSLNFIASLFLCLSFLCFLSFSFLRVVIFLFFLKRLVSFYTERLQQCFNVLKHYSLSLLNGVVAIPNNVIYRFLT